MQDAGTREPAIRKWAKAFPGEVAAITPAAESAVPIPNDLRPEGEHTLDIARDSMIIHVALHHLAEPSGHVGDAVMQLIAQLLFNDLEFSPKALGNGLASDNEAFPVTGSTTDMCETQEIEGLRLTHTQATPTEFGIGAEFDQARFIRVKGEAESSETFLEVLQESFRFLAMLESQDVVVRISDNDNIPRCMTAPPLLYPQVQDVMKIHIGKQRRDHRALGCTHSSRRPLTILGDSCPEPLADQAENPSVSNPVLEEVEQPFMVDGIEKGLNVCIEHPVHSSFGQAHIQGVQPVMGRTPGPETVRKSEEVHLIDGVENRGHCMLDDLVGQGSDPQGTLASVRLGDVGPLGRLCTIGPAMNLLVQVVQPLIQTLLVHTPCDSVNSGCSLPLKVVKALPESFQRHMME